MTPEWFLDAASAFLEERLLDDLDASARVTRLERSSTLPDDEKQISPPRSSSIGPAARLPPLPSERDRKPKLPSEAAAPATVAAAPVPPRPSQSPSGREGTTSVDRAMEGLASEMGSAVLQTHMKRHSVSRPMVTPPTWPSQEGHQAKHPQAAAPPPRPQCRSPPKPSPSSPALLIAGRTGSPLKTVVLPPRGIPAVNIAASNAASNAASSIKGSSSVSTAAPSSVTVSPRRLAPSASAPRPFAVSGKFTTSPVQGAASPVRGTVVMGASNAKWPPAGVQTHPQPVLRGSVQARPAAAAQAVLPREHTLPAASCRNLDRGASPVRTPMVLATIALKRPTLSQSPTRLASPSHATSIQMPSGAARGAVSPPRSTGQGVGTRCIPHAASCIDLRSQPGVDVPVVRRSIIRSLSPVPTEGFTPSRNTIASPVGRMACLGVPPPRVRAVPHIRKLVPSSSHSYIQRDPGAHVPVVSAGAVAPPARAHAWLAPPAVKPPRDQSSDLSVRKSAPPSGSHDTSQVPTWASMQVPARAVSPVGRSSPAPPSWLVDGGDPGPQHWQVRTPPPAACGRATLPAGRPTMAAIEGVASATRWSVGAVRKLPQPVAYS
mmetsp:Transcript_34461/g.73409  ORF Transcript_34461/g.73409 Transcript_34461/m.73409 type:complete len:605 (-) Transcript_34461:96-1910(-)